jgi:putative NIF3 family GTP cyclohydrolase 1 type 2
MLSTICDFLDDFLQIRQIEDYEELKVNLIYGGHYATETFGVGALAAQSSSRI